MYDKIEESTQHATSKKHSELFTFIGTFRSREDPSLA